MKQFSQYILFFSCLALSLTACKGGNPEFSDLDPSKIPRPTLSGKTVYSITLTSANQSIPLIGECDPRVLSIEVQIKDLSAWESAENFSSQAPVLKCGESSAAFSLNIKSLSQLGYWSHLEQSFSFQLWLRAITKGGASSPTIITVNYKPEEAVGKPPAGNVSVDARLSTSSNYKMDGRIQFGNSSTASSGQYKIRSGTIR